MFPRRNRKQQRKEAGAQRPDTAAPKQQQQQKHQQKQNKQNVENTANRKGSNASSSALRKQIKKGGGDILDQFKNRLESGTFRLLNESVYTSPNAFGVQMLKDQKTFADYHRGYRQQLSQWPINPNQIILDALRGDQRGRFLQNKPKSIPGYIPTSWVIADMGCGDAMIAKEMTQSSGDKKGYIVHSFDVCSTNPLVTACDMAKTPLEDGSVEICIFSLSLMATDWPRFISEAHRILKAKRLLKIIEVRSRLPNPSQFAELVEGIGFTLDWQDVVGNYFVAFDFIRNDAKKAYDHEYYYNPEEVLQPCIYKRR